MKKYFSFSGRATRSEYWGVMCLSTVLACIIILLAAFSAFNSVLGGLLIIGTIMASIIAQLSTTIRRLRDAEINPWFCLAVFIPYVGLVAFILFGCLAPVTPKL